MHAPTTVLALLITGALLTGCATQPQEPSAEEVTADTSAQTDTPEEPAVEEPDPSALPQPLADAVAEWTPLSQLRIEPYGVAQEQLSAREMRIMSNWTINYVNNMMLDEQNVLAEDLKDLNKVYKKWASPLMADKEFDPNNYFAKPKNSEFGLIWAHLATRIPPGSTLLDTSVATYTWHATTKEYSNAKPGAALTLMLRVLYHFEDPDGVVRAVPVTRWVTVETSKSVKFRDMTTLGVWSLGTYGAFEMDHCARLNDGVFTTQDAPEDLDVDNHLFFTTPVDEYISAVDYDKKHPAPTEKQWKKIFKECAAS